MDKKLTQLDINRIVWKACDTFRGTIDATQYKDYILTMLFLKYVTDVWKDKRAALWLQRGWQIGRAKSSCSRDPS